MSSFTAILESVNPFLLLLIAMGTLLLNAVTSTVT
jgi:hypothetical protein